MWAGISWLEIGSSGGPLLKRL